MLEPPQGILGILLLIADVWALINVAQSKEDNTKKAIWIVLILLLPLLGVILWWFLGPRDRKASSS
jgi:Mg2+ and Co2+ transporter CorA